MTAHEDNIPTTPTTVTVGVRIRPVLPSEHVAPATKKTDCRNSLGHVSEDVVRALKDVVIFQPRGRRVRSGMLYPAQQYAFHHVFPPETTQLDLFTTCVQPIVANVVDGMNASVLVYGPTGSGKTYTMLGTDHSAPGVVQQSAVELFSQLQLRRHSDVEYTTRLTFVEVYNEQVRDLLSPNPMVKCEVHDDGQHTVIKGVTVHSPEDIGPFLQLLAMGDSRRAQAATGANDNSSRSHSVLSLTVEGSCPDGTKTVGTLTLVDLAGSERAAATTNRGHRMKEGAMINRSLLALGNVITALEKNNANEHFVNWRASKLTRLLRGFIGGNCRTVLIANVSPAYAHTEDTHNTLMYAQRAMMIQAKQSVNVTAVVDKHIVEYENIIKKLRTENAALRTELSEARRDVPLGVTATPIIRPYDSQQRPSSLDFVSMKAAEANKFNSHQEQLWKTLATCDEATEYDLAARMRTLGLKINSWRESNKGFDSEPVGISTSLSEFEDLRTRKLSLSLQRAKTCAEIDELSAAIKTAQFSISGVPLTPMEHRLIQLEFEVVGLRQQISEVNQLCLNFHNKTFLTSLRLGEAQEAIARYRKVLHGLPEMLQHQYRGSLHAADAWSAVSSAESEDVVSLFQKCLDVGHDVDSVMLSARRQNMVLQTPRNALQHFCDPTAVTPLMSSRKHHNAFHPQGDNKGVAMVTMKTPQKKGLKQQQQQQPSALQSSSKKENMRPPFVF
eukprot:PhF_6_TR21699/c0_g1_i1/m.30989/K10401/KIF18_19; kinesin family member 18/19